MFYEVRSNFLLKMKFLIFLMLFLFVHCNSEDLKCGYPSDGIESIACYCENFSENRSSVSIQNITEHDRLEVIRLKVDGCDHVEIMKLIDNFPNLQSLDISYSGIESLDSFELKHENLTKFNASHNKLSDIPNGFFAKMPNVIDVDLSHNLLKEMDAIDKLPNKSVSIDLSHNLISDFQLFDNTLLDLEYLDLRNNSMDFEGTIEHANLPMKLKTIRFENNANFDLDSARLQEGVSVYVSWRDCLNFHLSFFKGDKIHIIENNEQNGLILRNESNGKIELHCSEMSFENIHIASVKGHQIENPTELLKCFSSSLVELHLIGEFAEELNFDVIRKFDDLDTLSISSVQLNTFDLSWISNKIASIRYVDSDLKHISNVTLLEEFKNLTHLNLDGNQIDNVPEIIQHLNLSSPQKFYLSLNHNYIGRLNATTLEKLSALSRLSLRNTSLSFDDLKPFESLIQLQTLDISYNNLESSNFTLTPERNWELHELYATHCNITNIPGLINQFVPLLRKVDLSYNNLKSINLTYESESHLGNEFSIYLKGNDLREIDFTKSDFQLKQLDISMNQFSCEYLASLIPQIMKKFQHLEFIGNPEEQKHGETC